LYKHVDNRDDLVRLAVDWLASRMPPPSADGGPLAVLDREAWAIWELLERHPGLALEMTVQSVPPASVDARGARVERFLRDGGLGADQALLALDLVADLAFDVAIRSHHNRQHAAHPEQLPADRDWFALKLEVVLAGIEAVLLPGEAGRS
jgi:hypothetical protein